MSDKSLLDDIFGTPEDQVETFMEAIQESVIDPNGVSRIVAGTPDQVSAPELVDQLSGLIRIQHGWHASDYAWHIAPAHPRRPFKYSIERVVYAIAKTMNGFIPNTTEVKVWLPRDEWDIKEITFKAIDLDAAWSVDTDTITKLNLKLFEVLNELI